MSALRKLPLFPLNTVLFPGMTLPLHIFEPRYRLMIGRCIQLNQPFGVVLIREGQEVGGGAVPFEIGTSAYVTHSDRLDDGRMNVQTVGYQRFLLHEMEQEEPFPVGLVEDYPVRGADDPQAPPAAARLRTGLRFYLQRLIAATGLELSFDDLPEDGLALAYFTAITLPLPALEKQRILSASHLVNILRIEETLLRRENMLLDHMLVYEPASPDPASPFSMN